MLTALFRRDRPAALLAVPLIVAVCCGPAWSAPLPPQQPAMPLYAMLLGAIGSVAWLPGLVAFLLITGIAVQLAFLANDLELFDRRNHLPALLLPVLMGLLRQGPVLDPALAGMPLVVWALRRAWMARGRSSSGWLFDSGALIGLAALFHLPYAFMLVVLSASNAVMRSFQWRDHVVPLIGLLTTLFLCRGTLFVLGSDTWRPLGTLSVHNHPDPAVPERYTYLLAGTLALFATWASLAFASSYRRSVIHGKNLRSAWLAFGSAASVLLGFEFLLTRSASPVLGAVPLALFLAYPLLQPPRPWLAGAAFLWLVVMALWSQWTLGLSSAA